MKLKKHFLITIMVAAAVIFVSVAFASSGEIFEKINYSIKVGKSDLKLQYPIYLSGNRIYVSLRSICDELNIPLMWDGEKNEAVVDIYNKKVPVSDKTEFLEEGVIGDEQTALTVGKAILEKYAKKSLEYETDDKIYYLTAAFDQERNSWNISQTFKYKDENKGWSAGGMFYMPNVILSKQTGEVLYINTGSSFSD